MEFELNPLIRGFIFTILWFLIVFMLLFIIFENEIESSYYSVISACEPLGDEIISKAGYEVIGQYNTTDQEITIFTNDTEVYESVNVHELCHKRQHSENRLYGCENRIGLFLNELECNLAELISK